ncbi:MAG: DJ-1/PfpI family protein, partial [Victivallales bacterium]|nr:DJ-1/PfpI family protein [Victivallales bacterium]
MSKTVAVLLADGFEEIEAITPIDILRRLEFNVIIAGLSDDVSGAHGIKIDVDKSLDDLSAKNLDAVLLPGGLPGSTHLRDDERVIRLVREMAEAGKIVSAICAAPIVLAKAGLMKGKTCTGYPME